MGSNTSFRLHFEFWDIDVYAQVDIACPDFVAYYNAMEQAVVAKVTALNVVFHRTAALVLKGFIQELLDR